MADDRHDLNAGPVSNALTTSIGVARGALGQSIENKYYGANQLHDFARMSREAYEAPNIESGTTIGNYSLIGQSNLAGH